MAVMTLLANLKGLAVEAMTVGVSSPVSCLIFAVNTGSNRGMGIDHIACLFIEIMNGLSGLFLAAVIAIEILQSLTHLWRDLIASFCRKALHQCCILPLRPHRQCGRSERSKLLEIRISIDGELGKDKFSVLVI